LEEKGGLTFASAQGLASDHLRNMSTVDQIVVQAHHDIVFHVMILENRFIMTQTITAMANRLYDMTQSNDLKEMMETLLGSWQTMGIVSMQSLWILLFNVDIRMKEYILDPAGESNFRVVFNLDPLVDILQHPGACLRRCAPMPINKARRFLTDLHGKAIPDWMQNQVLEPKDLITSAKDYYINA
jgi:hypothetical protein